LARTAGRTQHWVPLAVIATKMKMSEFIGENKSARALGDPRDLAFSLLSLEPILSAALAPARMAHRRDM
jgi:hypothetical protein